MSESKLERIPYPTARWVLETSLNSVGTQYFKNSCKQFKAFRNNMTLCSPGVSKRAKSWERDRGFPSLYFVYLIPLYIFVRSKLNLGNI